MPRDVFVPSSCFLVMFTVEMEVDTKPTNVFVSVTGKMVHDTFRILEGRATGADRFTFTVLLKDVIVPHFLSREIL